MSKTDDMYEKISFDKDEGYDRVGNERTVDMRVILVRAAATMHIIEYTAIVNDDDAPSLAKKLRALDKRNEYRIDVLIPEPVQFVVECMTEEKG